MMMKSSGLAKEGWRPIHIWAAAIFMAVGIAVTYGAWYDIFLIASRDEECQHAFLAFPAFVWLAWIRRGRLRRCQPTGRWLGTLMIGVGWVIWSIGFRKQWQPFWHGGALILVLGALFTAIGTDVLWEFLAAFAVLIFLVPVPSVVREYIAIPLQAQTAHVTQVVCEALGMDVDRQQSLLTVHGVQVAISEACNGMRMVFALIMVCYLFAFVAPLRGYVRFTLLILSPIIAAVFNIVRLVPTVWVYENFSPKVAQTFHDITGWVMLISAFLTLVGLLRLMRWAMLPVTHFRLVDVA
jgi:exosortase